MSPPVNEDAICFGTLRLYPQARLLLDGQRPVRLGGRALDLLIALAEVAPAVLSRAELEARVWPDATVEDTSLRVQISSLRKALGDAAGDARCIANVPGRGYSLVVPVWRQSPALVTRAGAVPACHALPARLTSIVGRDAEVAGVVQALGRDRLVTLVGQGGVGKSTVALAAAARWAAQRPDRVLVHVDLADGPDGDTAPAPPPGTETLWLLDGCEAQLAQAAQRALDCLGAAPRDRLLATSREALRIEGERVLRVRPLEVPPDDPAPAPHEPDRWPALALFLERARLHVEDELTDPALLADAAAVCRRVAGLPLALELAAAQLPFLGLGGLVRRLEAGLGWLSNRNRVGPSRHRSWRASLDWSWRALSPPAQAGLAVLSVVPGTFDVDDAAALVGCALPAADAEVDPLVEGVACALLLAQPAGGAMRYRFAPAAREHASKALSAAASDAARRVLAQRRLDQWRVAGGGVLAEGLAELQLVLDIATAPAGHPIAAAQAVLLACPDALRLPEPAAFVACVERVAQALDRSRGDQAPWQARIEAVQAQLRLAGLDGEIADADSAATWPGFAAGGPIVTDNGRWQPTLLDRPAAQHALKARRLWLQGQPRDAWEALETALERAGAASAVDLCVVLARAACPLALWCGDAGKAAQAVERLRALAERHRVPHWQAWAAAFGAVIAGAAAPASGLPAELMDLLATLQPGRVTPALLGRARDGRAGDCAAELLRAHGDAVLGGEHPERVAMARALFTEAAAVARRQGAAAWTARIAASLARLEAVPSACHPPAPPAAPSHPRRAPRSAPQPLDASR